MAYSEKVIDHYENPRNVGGFDKNDPSIAAGMVGAPACGGMTHSPMPRTSTARPRERASRRDSAIRRNRATGWASS